MRDGGSWVDDPTVLRATLDLAGAGVIVLGPDLDVEWHDEGIGAFFGSAGEELAGVDIREYVETTVAPALERPERFVETAVGAYGTDARVDGLECHVRPGSDRDERWLCYSSRPIEDGPLAGGRVEQYVDVTERRRAQRQRERYERIVATMEEAVLVVDSDRRVEYANEAALSMIGESLSAIRGRSVVALIRDEAVEEGTAARFERVLERVFEDDADGYPIVEHFHRDGPDGLMAYECRCSPFVADGTRSALVVVRDVSEQKRKERRYRTLVENFPNGAVTLVDRDLRYRLAGGQLFDHLSETPADLEGQAVGDVSAGDREIFVEAYRDALDGRQSTTTLEIRDLTLRLRTLPVYGDDGTVRAAIGMTQDITESEQRKLELQRRSRAIDEAPVGITLTDPSRPDNPITYTNDAFDRITGYSTDEATGRNCRFLQGEGTDEESVAAIGAAIEDDRPASVELRNYREDGTEFWNQLRIAPVHDESGELINYVGFQQDVTERKRRERTLRGLHTATRQLLAADSPAGIADCIVDHLEDAFEFAGVGVMWFDEEDGTLRTGAMSTTLAGMIDEGAVVSPGSNPVWGAFRDGVARVFEDIEPAVLSTEWDQDPGELLVAPVGDFGVLFAPATGENGFDGVDLDMVQLLAANAETVLDRIHRERELRDISERLSTQQSRAQELERLMESIQTIQRRIGASGTRDALETAVCEELAASNRIEFAWIGRPQTVDTDILPTAWAGRGRELLDGLGDDGSFPAQRAARRREPFNAGKISQHVQGETWAKTALSLGFNSVISVPLTYDGVLYGVFTAYSAEQETFDEIYENLFADVAELIVNYVNVLEQRYSDAHTEFVEIELELTDPKYPLHTLGVETGSTIEFDTVADSTEEAVRVLVSVTEGDPEQVYRRAGDVTSITTVEWFGDPTHGQLALTIQKPFLASEVGKHGGRLVASVTDDDATRVRVEMPSTVAQRPLVQSLTTRYSDMDMIAHRQTTGSDGPAVADPEELLTDRQYEILRAAYNGGYYETPREITGEDLAESFDVSSPTVYTHLQSAHLRLLERLFEQR